MANLVLRDVVAEYEKAEPGLRRRLEWAEAREEEIKVRDSARRAKRRRRRDTERMDDVVENGGVGTEEGGISPDVVCLDEEEGGQIRDAVLAPCHLAPPKTMHVHLVKNMIHGGRERRVRGEGVVARRLPEREGRQGQGRRRLRS